jgi:hypothetical protein
MNLVLNVIDASTGKPLLGAQVLVDGAFEGMTDPSGNIIIAALNGSEELTVQYTGYATVQVGDSGFIHSSDGTGQVALAPNSTNAITPSYATSPAPRPGLSAPAAQAIPLPTILTPETLDTQAIVTTAPGPNYLLIGAAVVGGILLLKGGKKKSVGKISNKQGAAIALGVVAVGGIYLFMQGKTTTTIISPTPVTGGGYLPAGAAALVPSSAVPLVNAGGGILSSLAKLFTGPAPTQAQTAQASSPASDPLTDLPAATQGPAVNYMALPTGVPAAPIAAPLPSAGISDAEYEADYNDAMSGFPFRGYPACPAKKASIAGIPLMPGMVIAGLGSYMLLKKKKSMGDTTMDVLLIGGLMVGGYLIYESIFGGTGANSGNNSAIATQTAAANQTALAASQAQIAATLNSAQANSLATDIYNQGLLATLAGDLQIMEDLNQIQNITDLYAIKTAFGTKQGTGTMVSMCNIFGVSCQAMDLDTWLKVCLDPSSLQLINSQLADQNINYQF